VIGGWRLTGWHDQIKARRAKAPRKAQQGKQD
jgi:hypothetical protein